MERYPGEVREEAREMWMWKRMRYPIGDSARCVLVLLLAVVMLVVGVSDPSVMRCDLVGSGWVQAGAIRRD